ncbi:hypothetical protein VZ95_07165 [Elstera litoralis]|uniref:DUF3108 domain-containing protein n=1 Tax=Elstera litoralis TaxID=552518 RepID=A0A0F3IWY1_9PROT|nr:DUF6134 family protein [Elstera litoralis]KJV10099.1 hypothetical protein VZ95_07165 [Elstera litoralis]
MRRLFGLALAGALLMTPVALAQQAAPRELAFTVERDGAPFGTHRISFSGTADALTVNIAIDLKVDFGPLTVFRYTHRNREAWQNGRLARIETATDDDGDAFKIVGRSTPDGFRLDQGEASGSLPKDILPTSYWHRAALDRSLWLDTQSGRLRNVAIQRIGEETITVAGVPAKASRYRVRGDLEMELWYLANGEWAGLEFVARGSVIRYQRITPADVALLPDGAKPAPAIASAAP